jgi:hypothetical protein
MPIILETSLYWGRWTGKSKEGDLGKENYLSKAGEVKVNGPWTGGGWLHEEWEGRAWNPGSYPTSCSKH